MAINAEWHKTHRMPKNPTLDQRLDWHVEHQMNCACRAPSEKLMEEIKKRKKKSR